METLFLSRLKLNPRNPLTRRDLGDCQQLHCTVLNAFPQIEGDAARQHFGMLFRVEQDQRGMVTLLVQSQSEPDWSHLPPGYLLEPATSKPVLALYAGLQPSHRLRFRLRANPTMRVSKNNTEQDARWRGKRIELRREEDRIAWLKRKADAAGFRLLSVEINSDVLNLQTATEAKNFGKHEKGRLSFGAALFNGELEITDAEKFKQALANGIGSGKAYGFGLLSIAPAG